MARITMRNSQKATFAQVFELYISAVTARGSPLEQLTKGKRQTIKK